MADDADGALVVPNPLPLNSHFALTAYTTPSCVRLPAITANNYEIKPGNAKHWLSTLPTNSITSWAQMSAAFLKKFFPIGKTLRLRQEITTFQQVENEQFYEAWERYGNLIRECPHHDIPKWQLVQSFYSGLHPQYRVMVDASCGGSVMVKNEEDAWQLFETMSEGSLQNVSFERRGKSVTTGSDKPRGMYEIKPSHDLNSKVELLTEKVEKLLCMGPATSQPPPYQEACSLCASPAHYIVDCPAAPQFPLFVQEQVNAAQGYANAQGFSKPGNDPFSTSYNQGWSKHPNFSWKTEHQGNSFAQQPRPFNTQFNPAAYLSQNQQQAHPQSSRDPSFQEKVLQALDRLNDTQQQVRTNTQSIARLETQVGQIANAFNRREEGRLPSQPVQPHGGQFVVHDTPHADAKVIMTLRNKREVETRPEKVKPKEHLAPSDPDDFGKESSQSKEGTPPVTPAPPTPMSKGSKVPPYVPKAPFPSCLNAPSPFPKRGASMEDILEVFKQVKVNIPLLDAIKQVPTYAKFLKDLYTQKRKCKTNVSKKVLLTEQVSSVFQSIAPPKLQDPGTPTISIGIGNHVIERALLDLGASVNLIPYSVYEQLGLGELKPTSVTLQLADRSIKVPRGVVEDVLVKVNDFYFPADFIVLDTEPVQTLKQTPVILGRPFLATANANIHVRSGEMEVTFGNMTLKLNVYKAARPSPVEEDCFAVDVLEDLMEEVLPSILTDDPLTVCLAHFDFENFDIDQSIEEVNTLLGSTHLMVPSHLA
ncbi:uncharacterized protein LOC131307014 [Rhododendron vialii]|uniref:uncharacterized protein LOC131307014 n=1 Tax=Rhododendron vialii TaxID=182163 RepID=UPI00265E4686|nr:uncharacterized protein LOC131307014 [Rhododendron vialii]